MCASVRLEAKNCLTSSKALVNSSVQMILLRMLRTVSSGAAIVANFSEKSLWKFVAPRNRCIALLVAGRGHFKIAEHLAGSILMEFCETNVPRIFASVLKNLHFF